MSGRPLVGEYRPHLQGRILSPLVSHKLRPFLSIAKTEDLTALAHMVDDGTLTPIVGATYSLTERGAAIAHGVSGHARGKITVVVD